MMIMPQDNPKPSPSKEDLASIEADLQQLCGVGISKHIDVAREVADDHKKLVEALILEIIRLRVICKEHGINAIPS